MRTSFLPGLALWSLFPRPQSHGPTFWTVFYGKRLVNGVTGQVPIIDSTCPFTADVRMHSWTTIRRRADSERLLLRGLVSSHRKTRHPMTCRI